MPPRRATREERSVSRRAADDDREAYDEEELPEEEAEQDPAAEEDPGDDGAGGRQSSDGRRQSPAGRQASGGVTAAQAAQAGMRSLVELTGKKPEGLTAVEPTDDGWVIGVEVIEDQRVPSSADVLAVYEAELDPDGGLVSYRRTARYARGRGDTPRDS